MSRLDVDYLRSTGAKSWKAAYDVASQLTHRPEASFKNLRDEFDPIHGNPRAGWHQRELRPNRQRVADELQDLSNEALIELVNRILLGDNDAIVEAIDSLGNSTRVAHNVAERLLTGRRAEEYFLAHCEEIVNHPRRDIIDSRNDARGFDFGVAPQPDIAIEVKGIKLSKGDVQFTDREWSEARARADRYWLVIVGNLAAVPSASLLINPHRELVAKCRIQQSVNAIWRATVAI